MPAVHRQDDLRICGATTIVIGQSTVFVNGKLWAVTGDPNTDGNGQLIATFNTVKINGKSVIVVGDNADPDDLCILIGPPHCNPSATTGSPSVSCYG
jgi:uncharacterized Zn-binding protein involved in type VI secretion